MCSWATDRPIDELNPTDTEFGIEATTISPAYTFDNVRKAIGITDPTVINSKKAQNILGKKRILNIDNSLPIGDETYELYNNLTDCKIHYSVKVIEHSICKETGSEIISLELVYPTAIHAHLMTHRVFSRNVSSSRATPIPTMLKNMQEHTYIPLKFGVNKPGMQAIDILSPEDTTKAIAAIMKHKASCEELVNTLDSLNVHKEVVNKYLFPFSFTTTIVTTTDLSNFRNLRSGGLPQEEIRYLCELLINEVDNSTPRLMSNQNDKVATNWHLPYITAAEREKYHNNPMLLCMMSIARVARVSRFNHDKTDCTLEGDMITYSGMLFANPPHRSPTEAVATPALTKEEFSRNFQGWVQYRSLIEPVINHSIRSPEAIKNNIFAITPPIEIIPEFYNRSLKQMNEPLKQNDNGFSKQTREALTDTIPNQLKEQLIDLSTLAIKNTIMETNDGSASLSEQERGGIAVKALDNSLTMFGKIEGIIRACYDKYKPVK
jgi:thymidylate synthase ThyX